MVIVVIIIIIIIIVPPSLPAEAGSVAFDGSGEQLKALGEALELLQAAIKVTDAPRILLCTGDLLADFRLTGEGDLPSRMSYPPKILNIDTQISHIWKEVHFPKDHYW